MGPAHGKQLWKVSTDAKFLIIIPETRCVSIKKFFFSFKFCKTPSGNCVSYEIQIFNVPNNKIYEYS